MVKSMHTQKPNRCIFSSSITTIILSTTVGSNMMKLRVLWMAVSLRMFYTKCRMRCGTINSYKGNKGKKVMTIWNDQLGFTTSRNMTNKKGCYHLMSHWNDILEESKLNGQLNECIRADPLRFGKVLAKRLKGETGNLDVIAKAGENMRSNKNEYKIIWKYH